MTSDLPTNPGIAERSVHAETKRMLEKIVSDYELLAPRAEERLRGRTPHNCAYPSHDAT
jgi:hypothetical protein